MKNVMIVGLFIVVASAAAQTNSQESCQSVYARVSAQREAEFKDSNAAALIQYGKALESIKAAYKQKGDIDSYSVVDAESKRFDATKVVSAEPPSLQYAEAVGFYRKQIQDNKASYEAKKVALLKQYVGALQGQIKDLMARGKMEEAKVVADSKKTAEFELADMESRLPNMQAVTAGRKPIPEEAKVFGGHHYLVVVKTVTWHEAKKQCEDMGGHLVIITSKAENSFVSRLADFQTTFIGCTDENKEGDWRWVDGTRVTWKNWAKGEPSNHNGKEHYGELYDTDGVWNDLQKNNPDIIGYICEWEY
jgi:hypothetical protein